MNQTPGALISWKKIIPGALKKVGFYPSTPAPTPKTNRARGSRQNRAQAWNSEESLPAGEKES